MMIQNFCISLLMTMAINLVTINAADPLPLFGGLPRNGRTLVNTFPFNQHNANHDHRHDASHHHGHNAAHPHGHDASHSHGHDAAHHDDHQAHNLLLVRQDQSESELQPEVPSINEVASSGERCVNKVMMVEETVYDEQIECHHSYDKRCHTTYSTDFEPQQVEECDENFAKNCYIEYKPVATEEPVEICDEKLVRNCEKQGPTVCETVYQSQCETSYHEHSVEEDVPECRIMQIEKCREVTQGYTTTQECDKWPKKVCELKKKNVKRYTPETKCHKIPTQVCGPGACPIEKGEDDCRQEKKTIIQEVPEETCNLEPRKVCKFITKLVPILRPKENCVDVPKEVCARTQKNPKIKKRPVIKKWCYTPTPESGLEPEGNGESLSESQSTTTIEPETQPPTTVNNLPDPTTLPPTLYEAPSLDFSSSKTSYNGLLPKLDS